MCIARTTPSKDGDGCVEMKLRMVRRRFIKSHRGKPPKHVRVLSRAVALANDAYDALGELLDAIVNLVRAEMGYDHFGILLADDDSSNIFRTGYGMPGDWIGTAGPPLGAGIVPWVFEHGEPLLVSDVRREKRYRAMRRTTRSELCVPLRTHKCIIGVINVESDRPNAFTSQDVELLTMLADVNSTRWSAVNNILRQRGRADRYQRERTAAGRI